MPLDNDNVMLEYDWKQMDENTWTASVNEGTLEAKCEIEKGPADNSEDRRFYWLGIKDPKGDYVSHARYEPKEKSVDRTLKPRALLDHIESLKSDILPLQLKAGLNGLMFALQKTE